MNPEDFDWDRLQGLGFTEKATGDLKDACWKGYTAVGMKTKNGRHVPNCVPVKKKKDSADHSEEQSTTEDFACWSGYEQKGMKKKGDRMVPNCVPKSEHGEGDIATAEMTPNYLPEEPGKGDEKNPQMGEQKIRMPRMEVIAKASNNNGQLAMAAAPNYAESEDFFEGLDSTEPNAAMAINQLRVMREKIDIMLGILYPDDNMEPWMATKLAMSAQNLASVADYMRFGSEA